MQTYKDILIKLPLLVALLALSVFGNAQTNTRPFIVVPNGFKVNSYTGNLYHYRNDMNIPAKGMDIDIGFAYNVSKRTKNWGMGKGWTFSYNMAYATDSLGIWIERMDGKRELYKKVGVAYKAPSGVYDTLVEYQPNKFYLRTKNNNKYFFENSTHKHLTKIEDLNSNQISISYVDSFINTISNNAGHTLTFVWSAGRLTQVNDNICTAVRSITYEYDTSGNPIKVTNPLGNFVEYYYDSTSRIVGYADELGRKMSIVYNESGAVAKIISCVTTHSFSYLPSQYKSHVTETVNGQRYVSTYQYDTTGKIIHKKGNCCGYDVGFEYDSKLNITKKTDGKGNNRSFEYDGRGNITKITDMLGNTEVYTYNGNNKVVSHKDKNGNITTYVYNAGAQLTEIHKPNGVNEFYTYDANGNRLTYIDGNNKTYTYEYNSSGYLTKTIDPKGGITLRTYDCHGNKLSEKDPNNNTTNYEYDALNQLTKITDAAGQVSFLTYDQGKNLKTLTNQLNKTVTFDYDGLNRLIKTTTPLGIATQYVYDEQGNKLKQIDAKGNITKYTYNSRKKVLSETDPLGNSMVYDYDDAGNRISARDKKGNITIYQYDDVYQLTKIVDPLGGATHFSYDANGNKLLRIDANGNITSYEYDALDRLTKINDANNKYTQFTYDGNNNITSERDKRGNITSFTFDDVNKLSTITNPLGGQFMFTRDANGNVITEKDELNHITSYAYNSLNQRTSNINPLGETAILTYDVIGNLKTVNLPNGNTITNQYDDDNRLTSMTDALGDIVQFAFDNNGNLTSLKDANNNTVSYQYDVLNRKTKAIDGLGKQIAYTFDANDNIITETDRNNRVITYGYDALNRRKNETDAVGGITNYTFDANGNQIGIKDAKNNSSSFSYDALNRLLQETYPDGSSRQYTYDENGNTKTRKDNNGAVTNYTYDILNRLSARSYPGGNNEAFTYDAIGKILTGNNANANITYTYDNADRILSETLNGNTTSFAYNVANGTKTITYPSGRVITEEKDDRDRIVTIKDGATNLANFILDIGGRITQRSYSNGSITNYAYDANNRVTTVASQPNNAIQLSYTFDDEGNITTVAKGHNNNHSEAYSYDPLHRLNNFKDGALSGGSIPSPATQTQINYDASGNRTSTIKDAVTTAYTSNMLNSYTAVAAGSTLNPTYDANGNMLSDGLHAYAYDFENRIIAVDGGVTGLYKYDIFGRRIQKITAAGTSNFYYDGDNIIEERNAANVTQATFVYSPLTDDILSMRRAGINYFYLKNSIGSVVALLNAGGNVIERYEYDAFGKPSFFNAAYSTLTASAFGNNYLFTGREFDTESGNYNYRARYYSPSLGRFMQRDPLGYFDGVNLFTYASNNAVNRIDPYGLVDWWGVATSTIGVIGNGLGVVGGVGLATTTGVSGVGAVVGGAIAVKSAYGVGANLSNLWDALNDREPGSTGSLFGDVAREAFPCSDLAQDIATAADIATDLGGAAAARNAAQRAAREAAEAAAREAAEAAARKAAQEAAMKAEKEAAEAAARNAAKEAEQAAAEEAAKLKNGHLAGSEHPKTGVPFDKSGYPDFKDHLYNGGPNDVSITPGNSRGADFKAANEAAGYKSTPEGYTWHHHQDTGRMQLIETGAHSQTGHSGGYSLWGAGKK